MELASQIVLAFAGLVTLLFSLLFSIPSFRRQETRAGYFGLAGALCGACLLAAVFLPAPGRQILAGAVVALGIAAGLLLAFTPGKAILKEQRPTRRVDERSIMFARHRLAPGTPQYDSYYREHPEHQEIDDAIRALPGLLSPNAPMANPLAFAAADAAFFLTESLREAVEGTPAPQPYSLAPQAATDYLKQLARFWGAHSCGVAEVQDYQIYSHIGRGTGGYGEPIELGHRYVLVFTFEMAEDMLRTAPRAQEVMETAHQYSEAAQVAVQVAAWIRALGYPARAHLDGNYRLILPLAGRDAGLGEIGRMGLLITPDLGPRVRLSAVTTNLPLIPDFPGDSPAVLDFCNICRKCAENCPSKAIPLGDRQEIDGALRWKIDAEKCFRYWNMVGTDCGRCLMVCPYSHASDPAHNAMRQLVARSAVARRIGLRLDDWLYFRKPKVRPGPRWTQ